MNKQTIYNQTHNGRKIEIWFDDYKRGDANYLCVSIDNVIVMSDNIQAKF